MSSIVARGRWEQASAWRHSCGLRPARQPGQRRWRRSQTAGASLRIGQASVAPASAAGCATPLGKPEVLGVGACACSHCASRQQPANSSTAAVVASRTDESIPAKRTSHRQPKPGKKSDGHIKRQIGRNRLYRLRARSRPPRYRSCACRPPIPPPPPFPAPACRAHGWRWPPGASRRIRSRPGSASCLSPVRSSRLLRTSCSRSTAVCQALRKRSTSLRPRPCFCRSRSCNWRPNLHHARKIRPVLGAELRLLLLQIAAARVNLLQQRGRKVRRSRLCRRGSAAITSSGSPLPRRDTRLRAECGRWWRPPTAGPARRSPAASSCARSRRAARWPCVSGRAHDAVLASRNPPAAAGPGPRAPSDP